MLKKINYKKTIFFIVIVLIGLYLTNAKIDRNQSEAYFEENEAAIIDLLELYQDLYHKQKFSFGFLDNEYIKYQVIINSDSIRYIYKSDVTIDQNFKEIQHLNIDSAAIQNLAQKLINAKAIWIESIDVYLSGFHQKGTSVSFKSQRINAPFTPTKFLTLLVLDDFENIEMTDGELAKLNIFKIQDGVYHTISSQFR